MLTQDSPVSLTFQEYAQRLVDSTLLDVEEVTEYVHRLPDRRAEGAIDQLADLLKKDGKLTDFQDQRVRHGHLKGLVLGNYLVLDEIGHGANGMVFRARHRRMTRIVALKMIPPMMLQNENVAKRFHREVEAMSRVSHSNIVTAFDAGEDKGACFLILEYVNGHDLSVPIEDGEPLPVEEAVDYVLQAARGLAHAHSMGIVHRDIKPANLLLGKDGVVKILDMGLARLDDASGTNLTQTGSIMGTVDYMPPEQTLDSKAVDHRADIYSLGCTLHHLITGQPIYDSDSVVGKIIAHRESPIPSLCEARPEIPAKLDVIFQLMVAKDPEERYQSMEDVVYDLEHLFSEPEEEPTTEPEAVTVSENHNAPAAVPATTATPPQKSARSAKHFLDTPFGFGVTLLVALVATLGLMTWLMFG